MTSHPRPHHQPPPFHSLPYWQQRFTSNPNAFDWLLPASFLIPTLKEYLSLYNSSSSSSPSPSSRPPSKILHIGAGTSSLSNVLRAELCCSEDQSIGSEEEEEEEEEQNSQNQTPQRKRRWIDHPSQITNLDFAPSAIEWGIREEQKAFPSPSSPSSSTSTSNIQDATGDPSSMTWVRANLLDWPSVAHGLQLKSVSESKGQTNSETETTWQPFTHILEKSTSDAISCAEDVDINLPYHLSVSVSSSSSSEVASPKTKKKTSISIHPLRLLALHLAALTQPEEGRWIVISYSATRFDALFDKEAEEQMQIPEQIPEPATLWELERREEVFVDEGSETENGNTGQSSTSTIQEEEEEAIVHRPRVGCWLYVLRRTGVEISINNT